MQSWQLRTELNAAESDAARVVEVMTPWHPPSASPNPENKETFRRGKEGFFLFRGLSWSQGPKTLMVMLTNQSTVRKRPNH